jgi:hypothetical protein
MCSGRLLGLALFLMVGQDADPAMLVRQLASDSFEVRKLAEADLLKLGPRAETALRKGLTDSDAQVRDLCRQLLGKIQQSEHDTRLKAFLEDKEDRLTPPLAGWKRFSSLAGNGLAQRKRFLDLYRHAETMFEETARDPKKSAAVVAAHDTAARTALLTTSKEDDVQR